MVFSYSGWQWTHKNPIQGLNPPVIAQLPLIKVPVLIITGEKDTWDFQQIADILHKDIAHSLKKKSQVQGTCAIWKNLTNSIIWYQNF